MKKIKCLQKAPDAVCEACSAAGVSCRFRDRERYYAERSRMAAAAASSRGAVADRAHRDAGTMHNIAPATASTSHPPDPTHYHGGVARSPTKRASPYHPYRVTVSVDTSPRSSPESDTSSSPSPAPLFDPNERTRPNSEYMMNYIQVFFDNFNINFPFLAYDETIRQFFQHELSSLLANCIAAHAVLVQQSDIIPEAQQRRSMHIADQYCDTAKVWLFWHWSSQIAPLTIFFLLRPWLRLFATFPDLTPSMRSSSSRGPTSSANAILSSLHMAEYVPHYP